jgi:hypothetical protein
MENDEQYFEYLDRLRASSEVNMFAAAPYLVRTFALPEREAVRVLKAWMATYAKRHPPEAQS